MGSGAHSVPTLVFSHLVVPGVDWMFLILTGLLGKAERALLLTMNLRKQQTSFLLAMIQVELNPELKIVRGKGQVTCKAYTLRVGDLNTPLPQMVMSSNQVSHICGKCAV